MEKIVVVKSSKPTLNRIVVRGRDEKTVSGTVKFWKVLCWVTSEMCESMESEQSDGSARIIAALGAVLSLMKHNAHIDLTHPQESAIGGFVTYALHTFLGYWHHFKDPETKLPDHPYDRVHTTGVFGADQQIRGHAVTSFAVVLGPARPDMESRRSGVGGGVGVVRRVRGVDGQLEAREAVPGPRRGRERVQPKRRKCAFVGVDPPLRGVACLVLIVCMYVVCIFSMYCIVLYCIFLFW